MNNVLNSKTGKERIKAIIVSIIVDSYRGGTVSKQLNIIF